MARFCNGRTVRALAGGVALAVLAQTAAYAQETSATATSPAGTRNPAPATPGLGDIVVTAQKRKENIQETPIAITAVTSQRIEQANLGQAQQLQFTVPSMNFAKTSGYTYLTLRGVGNNAAGLADPAVATYQDGVYTGVMTNQALPGFDLERIEVLRGPQGTLYGRNTTGGVINYITKDPSFEYGAAGDVSYGNYNAVETNVGVTGPIVDDKIAARISFHYSKHDGYFPNVATHDADYAGRDIGGRISVLIRPTHNFSLIIRGDMTEDRSTDGFTRVQTTSLDGLSDETHPLGIFSQPASYFTANPGLLSPTDIAKLNGGSIAQYYGLIQGVAPSPNPITTGTIGNWNSTLFKTKTSGASITATWDIGSVTVKSISGYRYSHLFEYGDIGGMTVPLAYILPIEEQNKQYTQEFNVSGKAFGNKLDWLVGAFYYHNDGTNFTADYLPTVGQYQQARLGLSNPPGSPYAYNLNSTSLTPLDNLPGVFPSIYQTAVWSGPGNPGFPGMPAGTRTIAGSTVPAVPFFGMAMSQKSDSYAGFAQATYHLTDRLRLTGGFRFTIDRKEATRSIHSNFAWDLAANGIYQAVQAGYLPPAAYNEGTIAAAAGLCENNRTAKTWRAPTGMVSLDYDAADHVLTYAKASWGYKAGGMNNGECGGSYDPEYLAAYEGGVKAVIADGQILTNVAAYYYDYSNIQFAVYANNTSNILNAASAKAFGIEFEYAIRPRFLEGWQLDGSASFEDSHYGAGCFGDPANLNNAGFLSTPKQACPATVVNPNTGQVVPIGASANVNGNELIRSPRWKANVGLQYATAVGEFGNLLTRFDAAWTSKKYNDIWNGKVPGTDQSIEPANWILNALLGWTSPDKRYGVEAFGQNLTNTRYLTTRLASNLPSTMYNVIGQLAPPRTYGIRLRVKLGSSAN